MTIWREGGETPYFFIHFSSNLVKVRLDTKNQIPWSSVVVGWGGGGFHLIMWSHQLRIGLKLGVDNIYEG